MSRSDAAGGTRTASASLALACASLVLSSCGPVDCSKTISISDCGTPMRVVIVADDDLLAEGGWQVRVESEGEPVEMDCNPYRERYCDLIGDNFYVELTQAGIALNAWNGGYPGASYVQILPEEISVWITPPNGATRQRSWTFFPDHKGAEDCVECQIHRDVVPLGELPLAP